MEGGTMDGPMVAYGAGQRQVEVDRLNGQVVCGTVWLKKGAKEGEKELMWER